jgi:hypothetical protein
MKNFIPSLLIVVGYLNGAGLSCLAQVPGVPRPNLPGRPGLNSPSAPDSPETLSANYQVTFSATAEGKALGELSMLTCSPQVSVSGPLNSGMTPTTFTVNGTLGEKDGELLFSYGIGFSLPVTSTTISPKTEGQPVVSNIQYQQHSSQGMLRMKPGTAYEVLKAAGAVYTITISPVPSK